MPDRSANQPGWNDAHDPYAARDRALPEDADGEGAPASGVGPGDDYLWDKSGEPDLGIQRLEKVMSALSRLIPPAATVLAGLPTDAVLISGASDVRSDPSRTASGETAPVRLSASPRRGRRLGDRQTGRKRPWAAPVAGVAAFFAVMAVIAWPMRPWGPGTQRESLEETDNAPVLSATTWTASKLEGAPTLGPKMLVQSQSVRVNEWVTTDRYSRAKLESSAIGSVVLGPDSSIRIRSVDNGQQWLDLRKGRIESAVHAPPRLVFVETGAVIVVDMGSTYTLGVDEQGSGRLHVTGGWVELQRAATAVRAPMGFVCGFTPTGPGLPLSDGASALLTAAAARYPPARAEPQGAAADDAARDMRAGAGAGDGVTLWNLLRSVPASMRPEVTDRLWSLSPPPADAGVEKAAAARLDEKTMDAWWESIRRR